MGEQTHLILTAKPSAVVWQVLCRHKQKRDEEEQDKEPQPAVPLFPNINPFKFAFIQKITSAVDIVRQLRSPDIFALNCSYRI